MQDESAYHALRARAELDSAARATAGAAAEAHRRLSALHMEQLRRIDESCDGSAFRGRR